MRSRATRRATCSSASCRTPICISAARFECSSSSRATSSGAAIPRPLDRDDLDVLQAFASFSLGSFTVRGGRQEIQYASSRLVSIREGPNVRLAFDGLRFIQRIQRWQVDGFVLVPVEVRPGVFDDRPEPGQWFWGVYATGPVFPTSLGLDVYYLGRFRETAAFEQGTAASCDIRSGRASGVQPAGFDYNVEVAYQAGTFGAGEIAAWMLASDVGYTVDGASRPTPPRRANERDERGLESGQRRPPDLQPAISARRLLQPGQPDRSDESRRFPSGVDS